MEMECGDGSEGELPGVVRGAGPGVAWGQSA